MFSLKFAELAISLTTFFLAYIVIVTFVGYFRAWVAEKMGDDSAEQAGFLTLNPLQHMDVFGMICLVFMGIGWGRHIPINPLSIHGTTPFMRWLKLCVAYWSDVFTHVLLAVFSMAGLLMLFGSQVILLSADMMLSGELSHMRFASAYPAGSSLAISCGLILVASIYLNVFLAVFNLVFRGLELFMMYVVERWPEYARFNNAFVIIVYALIVALFVTPQLRLLLVIFISHCAYFIAHLFGGV